MIESRRIYRSIRCSNALHSETGYQELAFEQQFRISGYHFRAINIRFLVQVAVVGQVRQVQLW
jgi:hypothetical protein